MFKIRLKLSKIAGPTTENTINYAVCILSAIYVSVLTLPFNFLPEIFLYTFLEYSWLLWKSVATCLAPRFPRWKLRAGQDLRFFSSEERPRREQSQQGAQPQRGVWLDATCHQNPLSAPNRERNFDLSSAINADLARLAKLNENSVAGVNETKKLVFP